MYVTQRIRALLPHSITVQQKDLQEKAPLKSPLKCKNQIFLFPMSQACSENSLYVAPLDTYRIVVQASWAVASFSFSHVLCWKAFGIKLSTNNSHQQRRASPITLRSKCLFIANGPFSCFTVETRSAATRWNPKLENTDCFENIQLSLIRMGIW